MTSATQHTNGDIMNTNPHTQTIDMTNNLSTFRLSLKAGVESPDAVDSPGAQFLASVRDALVEWVEYARDIYDVQSLPETAQYDALEEVDATVPVYTHSLWQTFTDLAAYDDESAGEFDGGTMTETVSYVLARIAERLFVVLAEEYVSAYVAAQDEALGECDADENGECNGACVSRPHAWSPSGARCTRANCAVVGSGDRCGNGNCEGND